MTTLDEITLHCRIFLTCGYYFLVYQPLNQHRSVRQPYACIYCIATIPSILNTVTKDRFKMKLSLFIVYYSINCTQSVEQNRSYFCFLRIGMYLFLTTRVDNNRRNYSTLSNILDLLIVFPTSNLLILSITSKSSTSFVPRLFSMTSSDTAREFVRISLREEFTIGVVGVKNYS